MSMFNKPYIMPEEIKKLITYDFLKEFRKELFAQFDISLDTFADDGIYNFEGTAGWAEALKVADKATGTGEIIKYWDSLEWYDSDRFDHELTGMLIANKLILPSRQALFEAYLNIDYVKDTKVCDTCGGIFLNDMVAEFNHCKPIDGEGESEYICKFCRTNRWRI